MFADLRVPRPCRRPRSTLEEIEKLSQALLAKGTAIRFMDKGEDSKEVAKLIGRLWEAITLYQVSGYSIIVSSTVDTKRVGLATTSDLQSNHRSHRRCHSACLSMSD